jgi:hypothetical protein
MPRLPAFLDEKPPLEHDVFGNLENPFTRHGPDVIRQPAIEIGDSGQTKLPPKLRTLLMMWGNFVCPESP